MLKRSSFGFYGDLLVFPGGGLEIQDSNPDWNCYLPKNQPLDLNLRLCAIRETFEEVGLFIGDSVEQIETRSKNLDFLTFSKSRLLLPKTNGIQKFANWVSPKHHPKRFDTMFYISTIKETKETYPDNFESISAMWATPSEILNMFEMNKISILAPQYCILQELNMLKYQDLMRPRLVPKICPELVKIDENYHLLHLNQDPLLNSRTPLKRAQLKVALKEGKVFKIDWVRDDATGKL